MAQGRRRFFRNPASLPRGSARTAAVQELRSHSRVGKKRRARAPVPRDPIDNGQAAKFANMAYYHFRRPKAPKGYRLDETLSTNESQVFFNPEKKKVVHTMRGTVSLDDFRTDATHFASGRLNSTPRYARERHKLQRIKKGYAGYDVHLVGHSLGGTLVDQLAQDHPDHIKGATTFNKIDTAATLATDQKCAQAQNRQEVECRGQAKTTRKFITGDPTSRHHKASAGAYRRTQETDKGHRVFANSHVLGPIMGMVPGIGAHGIANFDPGEA